MLVSIFLGLAIFENFFATADLSATFKMKKNLNLKLNESEKTFVYEIPDYKFPRFNETIENEILYKRIGKYQQQISKNYNCHPESKKVFFIGSSTTENDYIPESKRFTNLFSKGINSSSKQKFCIFNYGVGGNILLNAKTILFAYGTILKPDYVITMFNGTDLGHLVRNKKYDYFDNGERSFFEIQNSYPLTNFELIKEFLRIIFQKLIFLLEMHLVNLKKIQIQKIKIF